MNPLRVAAVFRRIVAQFRRDPRSLALLYVAPLAIIALLGWVLSSRSPTTARRRRQRVDQRPAGSPSSSKLDRRSTASRDRPRSSVTDDSTARQMLKDKKLDLVVILPSDFSVENRKIELLTRSASIPPPRPALPAVQKALIRPVADSAAGAVLPTIERATVYGSPDATQLDTLAPVVVGFFAYFFVFILTGISFLRERIGGTLERLLATPVSRAEIVLGYSLGFGFFATLQVAMVLAFVLGRLEIPALGPVPAFAIGLGVHTAGNPLIAYCSSWSWGWAPSRWASSCRPSPGPSCRSCSSSRS
jgi:ABC-2 type transport system permease protein